MTASFSERGMHWNDPSQSKQILLKKKYMSFSACEESIPFIFFSKLPWSSVLGIINQGGVYYMFGISFTITLIYLASLVAQMIKHLPAMWETWVRSLGWEDPVEKEMATHSSTLAWRIPWTEKSGRLQSLGSQRVRYNWATSLNALEIFFLFFWQGRFYFFLHCWPF